MCIRDSSKDKTWELIQGFAKPDEHFIGIAQSRNRGHQNAVLAGLMEALHSGSCDITISIDCDGQDDKTTDALSILTTEPETVGFLGVVRALFPRLEACGTVREQAM